MTEKPKPPFREKEPEPAPVVEPPKVEYAAMETAPLDGTHIMISDGTKEVRALWAKTRKMFQGRWTPSGNFVGCWDRAKLTFEPIGWRLAPSDEEMLREDTERARREDLARRA